MRLKSELRSELARRVTDQPADRLFAESTRLCQRLLADPGLREITSLGVYLALPGEPDLAPALREFLARGVRLALPFAEPDDRWRFRWIHDLTPASTGPWHLAFPLPGDPVDAADLDAILVPGRGFTREGDRIGRGKGIYDRLLSGTPARTLGICYSSQLVDSLPREPHDVRLGEVWSGD